MSHSICFPALVITPTSIDRLGYRYLVADKRFVGKWDVLIVDSRGNCYDVKATKRLNNKIDIWYSIKLGGIIVKVEPVLNKPVFEIPLEEIKKKLATIINNYPRKFSPIAGKKELITQIEGAKSYLEIVNIFGR